MEKIFVSFLAIVSIIIINSTTAILTNIIFKVTLKDLIYSKNIFRFITIILTKVIYFLTTQGIIKLKRVYKYNNLNFKEWVLLLFSPIVSIFFCTQIIDIVLESGFIGERLYNFLFFTICIVLVNILNYYLFLRITKNRRASEELEFLKYQLYYQQKNIENIKNTYNDLQLLRHDMQNNIFCISALLEQKEYEKAYKYLSDLSGKIENTSLFANTNNKAIDCILNLKIQSAKNLKIKFTYDIASNITTYNEVDFCILLANLLDNAIEACQKIDVNNRSISLTIKNNNFITIIVKNTIKDSVLKNNPSLNTIKEDLNAHGFGTLSIKSIVKKYNGYLNYYEKNGKFCCQTILPQI